jgi:hypothetical protein
MHLYVQTLEGEGLNKEEKGGREERREQNR